MCAAAAAGSAKPTPENAFYDSLTLGLIRLLNNTPRIANVTLDKRPPCERTHVSTWEQRHNVYLPDDMKRFYLSTDGFTLHWSYQYTPEDLLRVGFFSFPQLVQITLLRESVDTFLAHSATPTPPPPANGPPTTTKASTLPHPQTTSSPPSPPALPPPALTARSKIFELSSICELAKVCLIYEQPECVAPQIYLLELATLRWHFLAESFSEYHRMAIVHLGLPSWELCFSQCALPAWTEQLFLLLAPHLLEKTEARRDRHHMPTQPQPPFNQLDAGVFRTAVKATAKAAAVGGAPGAPGAGGSAMRASSQHRGTLSRGHNV